MKCALATLLVLGVAVAGCGDLASLLSGAGFGAAAPGGGGGSGAAEDDIGQEAGGTLPGQTLPTSGVVSARVRNFTDLSADVTLRFLLRDVVVHLSFLRVPNS